MARIRTIKPEFWTDEKIVELKPYARLLFIGLWNLCDDHGRMDYSPKRIKLQIFPADKVDVAEICGELRHSALINIYSVEGREYIEIINFKKHQHLKDNHRPSKFPDPPAEICAENLSELPQNAQEGKGREGIQEGKGKDPGGEGSAALNSAAPRKPPFSVLLNLYHEFCKELNPVEELTPARKQVLGARWDKRPTVDFWEKYFKRVSASDFLCGRAPPGPGRSTPFKADFEWIIKQENFIKILEGRYDNRDEKGKDDERNKRILANAT